MSYWMDSEPHKQSTLLISFLKASKIKQWLVSTQAPPIIQGIISLYDHIYIPIDSGHSGLTGDKGETQTCALVGKTISMDIWPLYQNNNSEIHHQARLKHDGVMYSIYQTHHGNSEVFFYPNINKNLASIAGFVQYIYSVVNVAFLVVQHSVLMDESLIDPFAVYIHWPA